MLKKTLWESFDPSAGLRVKEEKGMSERWDLTKLAVSWMEDDTVTTERCATELLDWVREVLAGIQDAERIEEAGKAITLGPLHSAGIAQARDEIRKMLGSGNVA